eukprot:GHVU01071514.1.p2 GENE.GHVU01071514.1~~GHVU01071514.1.p2  ORF type:complete len:342 (+),score=78.05 GHVU01071514.1:158-1183(+)
MSISPICPLGPTAGSSSSHSHSTSDVASAAADAAALAGGALQQQQPVLGGIGQSPFAPIVITPGGAPMMTMAQSVENAAAMAKQLAKQRLETMGLSLPAIHPSHAAGGGGGVNVLPPPLNSSGGAAASTNESLQQMAGLRNPAALTSLGLTHQAAAGHSPVAKETEGQQIARTICVENAPTKWQPNDIDLFFAAMAPITDKKLLETGSARFALVEFASKGAADMARKLDDTHTHGVHLKISRAKTTVTPRDPDNVSFELPPGAPIPVAYQQVNKLKLEEKLARVRAMSVGILRKLSDSDKKPVPTKRLRSPSRERHCDGGDHRRDRRHHRTGDRDRGDRDR